MKKKEMLEKFIRDNFNYWDYGDEDNISCKWIEDTNVLNVNQYSKEFVSYLKKILKEEKLVGEKK